MVRNCGARVQAAATPQDNARLTITSRKPSCRCEEQGASESHARPDPRPMLSGISDFYCDDCSEDYTLECDLDE